MLPASTSRIRPEQMTIDDQIKILSRRCERILSEDDLRKKLERNPDEPRWLKTVHGVGYKLEL